MRLSSKAYLPSNIVKCFVTEECTDKVVAPFKVKHKGRNHHT